MYLHWAFVRIVVFNFYISFYFASTALICHWTNFYFFISLIHLFVCFQKLIRKYSFLLHSCHTNPIRCWIGLTKIQFQKLHCHSLTWFVGSCSVYCFCAWFSVFFCVLQLKKKQFDCNVCICDCVVSNQDHFNEFTIASIDSSNINKLFVVVVAITPRRKCFQTK